MTPPEASPTPGSRAREFAVLVPILHREGEDVVLLTKRPEGLERYAGQVCLPGGERDPRDASLLETALREAQEEVGIPPERVEVLRELGWHESRLLHRVKPFVGRVRAPCPIATDPREVERVLYLPVRRITAELFEERGRWVGPDGEERVVYTFQLEGCEVWGLTARVLREAFVGA
ncbi:MAG: CoA pyrophosphatase [Planctomycetes bacterium]|nr:CoA pyrophosphatase [Planctomycetota bacterium]